MKKTYISPSVTVVDLDMQALMITGSISNAEGEVQTPIEESKDENFEAGAGGNDNSFDLWDE